MKNLSLLLALAFTLSTAVVSCGKDTPRKTKTEDAVAQGNKKVAELNATIETLGNQYGINVSPMYGTADEVAQAAVYSWGAYSATELKSLRAELEKAVSLSNVVEEFYHRKDVIVPGDSGVPSTVRYLSRMYLESLDNYEKSNP